MERLTSIGGVPAHLRGGIIALGNFDGFHLGHQAVVARARAMAAPEGRPVIIGTFDPHPARFFRPDTPAFRLTMPDQRARIFAAAGAAAMLTFQFDAALAAKSPADFVAMLAGDFGAAGVVTGEDYTFGKARAGNVAMLAELAAPLGLTCAAVPPVRDASGEIVSSSRIREALQAGDCAAAEALLTRPFAIESDVIHGEALGRELGFPTANMLLGTYLRPAYGIYAVQARLADGRVRDGAANLGIRPSFDPPRELLETFLFDFSGDLYGQIVEISLIERLRGEAKFDGLDALKAQMAADVARARQILAVRPRLA